MQIDVVIGAQYGDEGKGLMVDYLSSRESCVVRFNGGAQAGHTVVTPHGERHVFSHLGAGTYRGARTFLSEHFLANPILFAQELTRDMEELAPEVMIDPAARVTTPWDMLLNKAVEQKRGAARHGSCGVGINETVERCLTEAYDLRVRHLLWSREGLRKLLHQIRKRWVPLRAEQLGVPVPAETMNDSFMELFLDCTSILLRHSRIGDASMLEGSAHLVFEGAQGLRLDEYAEGFPHVTRSRTGLPNVLEILRAVGAHDVPRVHYVTRCYVTRHGAGPLAGELGAHPFGWTGPETNTPGPYQGSLRYAPLIASDLARGIDEDIRRAQIPVRPSMVVTCLDQARGVDAAALVSIIESHCLPVSHVSYGPTRHDVRWLFGAGAAPREMGAHA